MAHLKIWKHVRDARDFNNIETVIKFFFLQGKAPKEIHAILTGTLACFLPGQAKCLPAPPVVSAVFHPGRQTSDTVRVTNNLYAYRTGQFGRVKDA